MAEQSFILSLYDKVKSGGRRAATANTPAVEGDTPPPKPQRPARRATTKRAATEDVQPKSAKRTKRAKRPTRRATKKPKETRITAAAASARDEPAVATPNHDIPKESSTSADPGAPHTSFAATGVASMPQHGEPGASGNAPQAPVDAQEALRNGIPAVRLASTSLVVTNNLAEATPPASAGSPSPSPPQQQQQPQQTARTPSEPIFAPVQESRPVNDIAANQLYAAQLGEILESQATSKINDFRRRHAQVIGALLRHARPANEEEILCLTSDEAKANFTSGTFHDGPILTQGQQPIPLQTVAGFLDEFYDDHAKVFVQDSSVRLAKDALAVKSVGIGQVKQRLSAGPSSHPWNCLEMATHVEDGLRPGFLSDEDCRLLTKLKIPASYGGVGRRTLPEDYKEVEKWALLAEGGACTEPHQDSHGYSTYITVNQGEVGFGWMSNPTAEDRKTWHQKLYGMPYHVGDYWRYVVLRPGQTVTFPAGTVHFVFRLPSAGHSLAFGGHFLRCSNLVHWVRTMLEQKRNRNISNEDLSTTATGHLDRVEVFVKQAQRNATTAKWGGDEAIEEFLRLKQEFMRGNNGKKA